MGKSKFQVNAQQKVKSKSAGKSRPQYYDEKIKTSSQAPSRMSLKSLVLVIGLVAIIGGGIFGVGNLLDNQFNPDNSETNPNYREFIGGSSEVLGESGYKMDISITDIDGTVINLADHAGKVVILYFHFLNCPPCGVNSPNLKAAMGSYNSSEIFGISISVKLEDSPALLKNWKTEGGYGWELVRDTDYSLSSRFGASATPHMVFLGKDGAIEQSRTGITSVSDYESIIESLL